MNLVVFGASGGTGRELVRQGLAQGHTITVFVRNPAAFTGEDRLRVVVGDARNAQAVAEAVPGQDAVLSALGGGLGDDTLLPEAMQHILAAMKQNGVRRLIVLGASGVWPGAAKRLSSGAQFFRRIVEATVLKKAFASQRAMQMLIQASDVDWTVVQPPRLVNAPGRGQYRVDAEALPAGGTTIARADLARFMLAQLTSTEWLRKSPFLSW
ncbi:MAG TPA: SDR family oxidoreductase [Acidobacteriaceae bacterium]|jgi:putative NADH-flavin reductase|nr:SDR family oxidoreductase [Acidobacteriaceae bacterium]